MRPTRRHIAAALAVAALAVTALAPLPAAAQGGNPALTCPPGGDGEITTYNSRTKSCGTAPDLGPGGCTKDVDGNCLAGTKQGGCINPADPHGDPVFTSTGGCPTVFCPNGGQYRDGYQSNGKPIMKGNGRYVADGCTGGSYDVSDPDATAYVPPPPPPKPTLADAGTVGLACHEWLNIVEVMAGARSWNEDPGPTLGAPPKWTSHGGTMTVNYEMRLRVLDSDRDRVDTATDVDGVGGIDGREPLLLRRQSPGASPPGDTGSPGTATERRDRDPFPYSPIPHVSWDDGQHANPQHLWPLDADGWTPWVGDDDGWAYARHHIGSTDRKYAPNRVLWLRAHVHLGARDTHLTHSDGTYVYGGEAIQAQVRSRAVAVGPGGSSGWTAWAESPVATGFCSPPRTRNPVAG